MLSSKFYYSLNLSLYSVRCKGAPSTQPQSPFLFTPGMSDMPFQFFILTTFLVISLFILLLLFTVLYVFGKHTFFSRLFDSSIFIKEERLQIAFYYVYVLLKNSNFSMLQDFPLYLHFCIRGILSSYWEGLCSGRSVQS